MRPRGFVPRWCSFRQDFAPIAPFRTLSHPIAPYRTLSHPAAEVLLIGNRLIGRVDLAASVRGLHRIPHPVAPHWAPLRTFFQLELAYATARFCAALVLIPTGFRTFSHLFAPFRTLSHPAAEVLLIGNHPSGRVDLAALARCFHRISHPVAPFRTPPRKCF